MTLPGSGVTFSGDEGTLRTPKIGTWAGGRKARLRQRCADGGCLAGAQFDHQSTRGIKQRRDRRGDRPVTVEPIGSAIERHPRIVIAHLGGKRGDFIGRDIGRVGDNKIKCSSESRAEIANHERCAPKPQMPGIAPRELQRAEASVGADTERIGQFREEREQERA